MRFKRGSVSAVAAAVGTVLLASSVTGGPVVGVRPATAAVTAAPALRPLGQAPAPAPDPAAAAAWRKAPKVTWPGDGAAEVKVPAVATAAKAGAVTSWVKADGLPVRVANAGAGSATTVRVEVLDQAAAKVAGMPGLLLRVGHADRVSRPTAVEVDYSGFRYAYGGDFGSRLRLLRLPDCALTTPAAPACRPVPVPSRNDAAAGTVSGQVADGLVAVAAGPSGSTGSFQPTSLAPSATWQVGLQSGDFTWSYPFPLPPMPGMTPDLGLTYSSGSVDGRVAATNNQPSWVGEGFDLPTGFIERSYKACRDDGGPATGGDLCWETQNAVLVLPGLVSGPLVPLKGDKSWRLEDDRGWRVDLLTDTVNDDDDHEYWRVTSPEGTQYFFGRTAAAGSTWTVPVFGNESGEPCHGTTFESSWCRQAYRWQLDHVVDRHGDVVSYFYERETNAYARAGTTPTPYVRGGYLSRVEYGLREGSTAPAPARVTFTAADRCLPGGACVPAQAGSWPDTPWDQSCGTTSCANVAPTFWLTKRLATVTTQVRDGAGYRNVDSWTLTQAFPATIDTTPPGLWLQSIVHTGHTGPNGAAVSLPAVTFTGTRDANRVDGIDQNPPMNKWRLAGVRNETGGQIEITYASQSACSPDDLPAADANGRTCFPAFWMSSGATSPQLGWFRKYVVEQIREKDGVAGDADRVTRYRYDPGAAAWHYDDSELVPPGRKSWGQWRGFRKVEVLTGSGDDQTLTEHVFLRGMNGDRTTTGTRAESVTGSRGGSVTDEPFRRGFARETTVRDGVNGAWISTEISNPDSLATTATRAVPDGGATLEAHLVGESWKQTFAAVAGGGTRETKTVYTYDDFGTVKQVDDQGDVTTPADDTCTTNTYARNTTAWIVNTVSATRTVGVRCGATVSYPDDLVSDRHLSYDSLDWGAEPVKGDLTRVEEASSWAAGAPVYTTVSETTPDAHGRPVKRLDGVRNETIVDYTPAVGGPVTEVTTTNALGHRATTVLDPARGVQTATVDANGGRTSLAYDALGRLTSVWLPGRATSAPPDLRYQYVLRAGGAAVTTQRLLRGTVYRTGYAIYDGLLRPRQTQDPAPGGGRVVTDTTYDEHGRVSRQAGPQPDGAAPSGTLVALRDETTKARTVYGYDKAGRETSRVFFSGTSELWRTTTSYGGDSVTVDPPDGAPATTTVTDARGRVVESRQYGGGSPSGPYEATRYTYTSAGRLATVTDPAGSVWRYSYDLRGRQTRAETPDTGVTSRTFDADGRLLSTTDARGRTISHTYDEIGRRTGTFEGTTKLAGWAYDSAPGGKGLLASATRYAGGDAYVSAVAGYDARGHRTGVSVTIPPAETGLAGTYTSSFTYNEAGLMETARPPAVGGLPAETLTYEYDELGLPDALSGDAVRYVDHTTRDGLGRVAGRVFGEGSNQVSREYSRDQASGRLEHSTFNRSADDDPLVSDVAYTYDPAGNVRSLTSSPDGAPADRQCFRYDGLRRLTEAWTPTGECDAAPSAAALGGAEPYWQSYTYDKSGNRLTEVQHAAGGNTTRAYAYPGAGAAQPHAVRSVTTTGPGGSRTDTYGYDARGGSTGRTVGGQAQQLTWDAEGRVASIAAPAGTTGYLYDADGERLLRRDPGGVTLYLGDTEIRRDTAGTVRATRSYRLDDGVMAVRTGTALSWMVTDHHGTVEAMVDADSLAVTRRPRLPFGGDRDAQPATWPGGREFAGGDTDPGGLMRLGAREYDPALGAFVSPDPVVDHDDPQQVQAYGYADANPVTFSDPDGRKPRKTPYNPDAYYSDYWACESFGSMCDGHVDPTGGGGWDLVSDVVAPNANRDASDTDLYGCYGLNPQPAVACRDLPQMADQPAPVLVYAQRPCLGWDQCITPRPYEWIDQDELDGSDATATFAGSALAASAFERTGFAGSAGSGTLQAGASGRVPHSGSGKLSDSASKRTPRNVIPEPPKRRGTSASDECPDGCGAGIVYGGPYRVPSGQGSGGSGRLLGGLLHQVPRGDQRPTGGGFRFGSLSGTRWPGGGVIVLG
ncbi:RHS repeat-associated core domain-containing protein [Nonomuraea roseoviolacea]|uniref:RHS repeat-associated protein n=1 Tax=Nonomuraea roseoviolacea subsp. carminata TaxID=160689 RepID=A0ABT1KB85_9ACTN|nr:RHS repeat-associated core domain-containing protein [Nonomuraea roseoviolacea]MCP2351220.1 RHS repeat-associated protein [Nonomuraea roseoviolacea subsp. carminata]